MESDYSYTMVSDTPFPWFSHSRLAGTLTTPSISDSTEVYCHRDHPGLQQVLFPYIQPEGRSVTLADIRPDTTHLNGCVYPHPRVCVQIPGVDTEKSFVHSILDIHGTKGDEREKERETT